MLTPPPCAIYGLAPYFKLNEKIFEKLSKKKIDELPLLLKEKYEKLLGRMISHDEILKLLSNDKLLKLDEHTYTICMLCGLPREFKLRAFFQKLSKKNSKS